MKQFHAHHTVHRKALVDADGARGFGVSSSVRWSQLIPRVIRQTHAHRWESLPSGISRAMSTWWRLNPEYQYLYYDDRAMRRYVARQGSRVQGFRRAFALAGSGAARSDLWRYLTLWCEGGVYADADSVLRRPLREIIRPNDEAVAGVGHQEHGPEQWVMAYRSKHPIIGRVLQLAVLSILQSNASVAAAMANGSLPSDWSGLQSRRVVGKEALHVTGPKQLYLAAMQVLGKPYGYAFRSSAARERHCPGLGRVGCVTILPGQYDCPSNNHIGHCSRAAPTLNTFGGNARESYKNYRSDLRSMGVVHWTDHQDTGAAGVG